MAIVTEEKIAIKTVADEKENTEQNQAYIEVIDLPTKNGYRFIKRVGDIILSTIALIVLLIPMLIIALVIWIDDPKGSPIFLHKRCGKGGKEIKVFKFRSMKAGAENLDSLLTPEQIEQYKKEFKIENDPRVTKVGKVIRKTSLDELPQFLNIFIGNLSFVGPRPLLEEETYIYGRDRDLLLSVKPGLTGYWQAYARNGASYTSGERQKMELYYVRNCSVGLDIKIMFKTVETVVTRTGAQ